MKNITTLILFIWIIIYFLPVQAQVEPQTPNRSEIQEKQEFRRHKEKAAVREHSAKPNSSAISIEKRKQEIKTKENSINRNKKVKRFSTDENLPETVRKRNIP